MSYDSKASFFSRTINETDIICQTCQEDATFKYVKVKDVEPEILYIVYECTECNIKNSSIFVDNANPKGVIIECHFSKSEDLRREINLKKKSKLSIEYKDILYEYISPVSHVTTVKAILKQAVDTFCDNRNGVIVNKEIERSVNDFKNILDEATFYMRIEDLKGSSRVGAPNQSLFQMQSFTLEHFNDDRVVHKFHDQN